MFPHERRPGLLNIMTTEERLRLLAAASPLFEAFTGPFDRGDLEELVRLELGRVDALDAAHSHGTRHRVARAPARILHVLSGNTPHAAFQSLLRGLLVGAPNHLKLPGNGLPEIEALLPRLPAPLRAIITVSHELPDDWNTAPGVVIVFGNDDTISWFSRHSTPQIRLISHGQRLSIGVVHGDAAKAARLAARDVSLHDQQGCLSTHAVYVTPDAGCPPERFASLLALEMERFDAEFPRSTISASEAGAITNLRETTRFLAASQPADFALWESPGSTRWTVVMERDPLLRPSVLNRVVYVKPWPSGNPVLTLGPEVRHLACLAIHPFPPTAGLAPFIAAGPSRICAMGETQFPPLTWHQDGIPPIATLISWTDLG